MDDLFALIKQNEELKEEIDRLKAEQSNMMENSRNVVKELETTIVEKAAEIQYQKHEIRRLSSAVETSDGSMESDMDKYNQVKRIREELQHRIDDLESINSELKDRLNEHETTKDSVAKQYNKMKQKLVLEREQNAELNRQILEVSDLYDTYYMKCGELEKGRIKGIDIDNSLGEHPRENAAMEGSCVEEKHEGLDQDESEKEMTSQGSEDSKKASSGGDATRGQTVSKKKASNKRKRKLKKQVPMKTCDIQAQRIGESVLMFVVNVIKFLFLIAATFSIVIYLYVYHGFSVGQIASTLFATYVFLYNLWRALPKEKHSGTSSRSSEFISQKLRLAMQDLILRLDEQNFEQFKDIYERFIVQSFEEPNQPQSLQDELQYLKSSKESLAKELARYKELNKSINADYNRLKRDIDIMRLKRIEEDEVNEKMIQALKNEIKSMEVNLNTRLDTADDGGALPGFMQGSVLKLLLFAILEGVVLMSASSSFILIPASFFSLVLLALVYRTDLCLRYTASENRGYQKTIKELLRKISEYREEGKQTSDEVRELEMVVDKDYQIISKQRNAMERLERQLQRAINKYREKKRTLGQFVWLQEQNISNFAGLETSDKLEHSAVDALFNSKNQSSLEHDASSTWKGSCLKILFAITISCTAVASWQYYDGIHFFSGDPFYLAAAISSIFLILAFVQRQFRRRNILRNTSLKAQLRESREDQQTLVEQVETLRGLLSTEREFIAKLEKQAEALKELPERRVPKEEVNAVIDRLIDVSKERDELMTSASSARDKYDHIKKTLEDILSREKYLSEEVSALRTQKRELQNDVMREQLKNIDMYEEVKRLQSEWDREEEFANKSESEFEGFAEKSAEEGVEKLQENELTLNSDSMLESLEKAGSYAQKNRKKRNSKRRQKEREGVNEAEICKNVLRPLLKEETRFGDDEEQCDETDATEKNGRSTAELPFGESVETNVENGSQGTSDYLKDIESSSKRAYSDNGKSNKCKEKTDNSVGVLNVSRDEDEIPGSISELSKVDENENSLIKRIMLQAKLLDAKDWELEHLNRLLDMSGLNAISRENSDSGTDCEKKTNTGEIYTKDCQMEISKLTDEILGLADLCSESKVDMNARLDESVLRPEDLFRNLTDHVHLMRYKLFADKATMVAKVNAMQEELERAQQKIELLHSEIAKEKKARNNLISEYEKEYERLEDRLSDAYENIRKRLVEERSLRSEILKQYEEEIEDMQAKTTIVLKGLQEQLKEERSEKAEAKTEIERMAKKIKELETELYSMEEEASKHNLNDFVLEKNEEKRKETKRSQTIKTQWLAEEEANKRVDVLKAKLESAMRSLDECDVKLNEQELIVRRFEKQEKALKVKIGNQSKRMKDLENEIKAPNILSDTHSWTGKCFVKYMGIAIQFIPF